MSPIAGIRLLCATLLATALLAGTIAVSTSAPPATAAVSVASPAERTLVTSHTTIGAYLWGYDAAIKHYAPVYVRVVAGSRPVVDRSWGWFPSLPTWISEAGWWIKKGASCGIGVGSFVALGGTTKIASALRKIATLAKTDKEVRAARAAARELGGFKTALKMLGTYASTRGKGVTALQKALLTKMVVAGGAIVADILGVKACFDMVGRLL